MLLDSCLDSGPLLERETGCTDTISVHIQLLPTIGFFLDTDTSGISQPMMMMMIMLAMLDAVISPASNYIQFQYKNSISIK